MLLLLLLLLLLIPDMLLLTYRCQPIYISTASSTIHPSIYLSIYLSIHPFILSIYLPDIYPTMCNRCHAAVILPALFACLPRASLDRMGLESMEIYQIHWPFGLLSSRYWDGLADCVDQGLVKVGSCRGNTCHTVAFVLSALVVASGACKPFLGSCVGRHVCFHGVTRGEARLWTFHFLLRRCCCGNCCSCNYPCSKHTYICILQPFFLSIIIVDSPSKPVQVWPLLSLRPCLRGMCCYLRLTLVPLPMNSPPLTKAVGVSNYGPDALKEAHAALKARGVQLGSNQIQFSLANR